MHLQARRLGDGAQIGDGRALAVGAGHMDHRRQALAADGRARPAAARPGRWTGRSATGCRARRRWIAASEARIGSWSIGTARRVRRRAGGRAQHQGARIEPSTAGSSLRGDDLVDHALLDQEFRALEARRQGLADGLLDHPGAGEADQGAGLGQVHVAQHGVGGGDAAGGRVGEHHDIGQAAAFSPGWPGWCAPSASGESVPSCMRAPPEAVKITSGHVALHGLLGGGDEGLARRHAQRAAHEGEVLHQRPPPAGRWMSPTAMAMASCSPVALRAAVRRSRIGLAVGECSGSSGAAGEAMRSIARRRRRCRRSAAPAPMRMWRPAGVTHSAASRSGR